MPFAQAAAYAHAAAEDFKVKAADKNRDSDSEKGFAMENIKKSIETAVEEIKGLAEEERKKQIKALRLRWHPVCVCARARLCVCVCVWASVCVCACVCI
jgi:Tfp pilus assembly major pilin PilA